MPKVTVPVLAAVSVVAASMSAPTPAQAHHNHDGALVAGLIAGAVLGAAVSARHRPRPRYYYGQPFPPAYYRPPPPSVYYYPPPRRPAYYPPYEPY